MRSYLRSSFLQPDSITIVVAVVPLLNEEACRVFERGLLSNKRLSLLQALFHLSSHPRGILWFWRDIGMLGPEGTPADSRSYRTLGSRTLIPGSSQATPHTSAGSSVPETMRL